MEKRLDAQAINGVPLYSIDNIIYPIGGVKLCQSIERAMVSPRLLGKSEMVPQRNIWTLYATGNNLRLKDDVTRRVIQATMNAGVERPELRTFKGNPFERVLADRGRFLWAALTVVAAYREAGLPGRLPWIGDTFGEWSDNVRSALVWLGRDDPVESMDEVRASDPTRQARLAIFQAIHTAYGDKQMTAAQMVEDADRGTIKNVPILDRKPDAAAKDLKAAIMTYPTIAWTPATSAQN